MAVVTAYFRPRSLSDALALCAHPCAVPIGGGTMLGARSSDQAVEVVDLQALGLGTFEPAGDGGLRIGATVTLQQLADHAAAPPVVREAAHRERPSTLRNQATVGGVIASGDAESELLAALLAHDAVVTLVSAGAVDDRPLGAVLAGLPLPRGLLVSSVTVATGGRAAAARTARTTADTPIVVAIARADGGAPRVALAGVAPRPVVVTAVDDLDPPGDFRGSGEYRAELARVLTARVVEALR